jgi:hypothetical protein
MGALEAYHNNTGSQHQDRFKTLSREGFRLISLSCYGDPDEPLYAAVWEQTSGPAWNAIHGVSPNEFQAKFNANAKEGFNPVIITATGDGNDARFAAVFEQNNKGTLTRYGLRETRDWGESDDVLFDHWNGSAKASGSVLIWLSAYGGTDRGDRRYAAIWQEQKPGTSFEVTLGATKKEYQQAFDFWTNKKTDSLGRVHEPHTPIIVVVNTDGPLYSAVWHEKNPWGQWHGFHGMSSAGYQNKFDDMKASGFYPVRVQGGGGEDDDIRFAALFAK